MRIGRDTTKEISPLGTSAGERPFHKGWPLMDEAIEEQH